MNTMTLPQNFLTLITKKKQRTLELNGLKGDQQSLALKRFSVKMQIRWEVDIYSDQSESESDFVSSFTETVICLHV